MRNSRVQGSTVSLNWHQRTLQVLALIIGALIMASLVAHALRFGFGLTSRQSFGFIRLFDLNQEANVPTWFSSIMLASCAVLLALIALAKRATGDQWLRHWSALSAIFLLMSLDEIASIHEMTIRPLHNLFELGPVLTNAWVLIALPLLIVFLLLYARFLLNLPRRARWLFLLSGVIYISGVVGIEVLSGLMKYHYGTADLRFALMTTFEESLEMLGIMAFVYALTDYMGREQIIWRMTFTTREQKHGIRSEQV